MKMGTPSTSLTSCLSTCPALLLNTWSFLLIPFLHKGLFFLRP